MYYVLYDLEDNIICYFNTLIEFCAKFNYSNKEINRKFRNSHTNYIYVDILDCRFSLFAFKDKEAVYE